MLNLLKITYQFIVNCEFAFIFLSCSLIFLICAAFIKNKYFKLLFIVFFSIFLTLSVYEFVLYINLDPDKKIALDTLPYSKNIINEKNLYLVSDEEKAYLTIPYTSINLDNEDRFYKNGFRYTPGSDNSKEGYVFLGCSYTYGDSVNHDETLPYYFSKLMNFEKKVLNCGVCSRGSNTALNILNSNIIEKIMPDIQIKHFFYLLIDDHIYRNFRLFTHYANDIWIYKNGNWKIADCPFLKVKLFFTKSYIVRDIFENLINKHNEAFYKNYLSESIKEMKKIIIEKYNSKLTVIIFPGNIKECVGDYILIPDFFNKYKAFNDKHPNAKAHKATADMLYRHIKSADKKN